MNDADILSRIAAELGAGSANLRALALVGRLRVPLPPADYSPIAEAPGWVAGRRDACSTRGCTRPIADPALWAIAGDTLICAYDCARCHRAWWTGWHIPALGFEFAL